MVNHEIRFETKNWTLLFSGDFKLLANIKTIKTGSDIMNINADLSEI